MEFNVVTICGSMRFYDLMHRLAEELTRLEFIVLMPFVTSTGDESPELKPMLDRMHLAKIDMSGYVAVVSDESGYYGESTEKEIKYAKEKGKSIKYFRLTRDV